MTGSGPRHYTVGLMRNGSRILLTVAIVAVVALALAIHFFAPSLGRALHGGQ